MKTPEIDQWGILRRYQDAMGGWHHTTPTTRTALRKAMGAKTPRSRPSVGKTGAKCYLPRDLRQWGWAVQLYSLRSRKSWGIGDFGDLRNLARWSAGRLGAGFLLLNPLCAASPVLPQEASPYYPSSRLFKNPLYLCIEEIPGAKKISKQLKPLARSAHALNKKRLIDRDAVFRLKMQALELIWRNFPGDKAFDRFCAEQGRVLETFATFCVLAEHHRSGWRNWPRDFQDPDSSAVKAFCTKHPDRICFFQWLQWLCDEQLARAAKEIPLMQDLPIGVDPAGADAWMWQKFMARGVSIGAPPDEFNTQGQGWGLQPFVPHQLQAADYEPFRLTIRAALRHARGLRIDHVMGLFRLFWIPQSGSPRDGAYVRQHSEKMLAIIASESRRAKAIIVGEDLGTVEEGVREKMFARNMLCYRLLWFENKAPGEFPRQALSAVTTHDLFTIAGLWSGSDLKDQTRLKLKPNAEGTRSLLTRLQKEIGIQRGTSMEEIIVRTYAYLAKTPSMLLTASLEDALGVRKRPNMPGTVKQWPNWSIALPETLEVIEKMSLPRVIAGVLRRKATKN